MTKKVSSFEKKNDSTNPDAYFRNSTSNELESHQLSQELINVED